MFAFSTWTCTNCSSMQQELHDSTIKGLCEMIQHLLWKNWQCTRAKKISAKRAHPRISRILWTQYKSCGNKTENSSYFALICCHSGRHFVATTYCNTFTDLYLVHRQCTSAVTLRCIVVTTAAKGFLYLQWVPLTTSSVTTSTCLKWTDSFASKSLTAILKNSVNTNTLQQRAIFFASICSF